MTKKQQKDSRAEARALIEKETARNKRNKKISILVIITLALASVITFAYFASVESKKSKAAMTPVASEAFTPERIDANGAFFISPDGKATEPTKDSKAIRMDMFFDPQCPGCGIVERGIGERVAELSKNGEIDLFYTPVAFLDDHSKDRYSTRSVNAVVTVAEKSPENLMKFVNALYAKGTQPVEGLAPLSNTKLGEVAQSVGVPESVTSTFNKHSYFAWIEKNTEYQKNRQDFFAEGFSTPSIFFNAEYNKPNFASNFTKIKFQDNDVLSTFNTAFEEAKVVKASRN